MTTGATKIIKGTLKYQCNSPQPWAANLATGQFVGTFMLQSDAQKTVEQMVGLPGRLNWVQDARSDGLVTWTGYVTVIPPLPT